MKSVLGLLLLLFATPSYGLESVCDATQDASVCYGALGGPVMLQLMRNTTGYRLYFKNEKGNIVFIISEGTVTPFSQFPQGRWQVVARIGTLIINPAERSDSGTYRVEIYKERIHVGRHTVQLVVGATPLPMTTLTPAFATTLATTLATTTTTTLTTNAATNPATTLETTSATTHQSDEDSLWSISPVFISVWLAEIIVLASLHLGSCYLHMRRKRTHTAGENQEVELSSASISRSRMRRRGLDEGEGPRGDSFTGLQLLATGGK